MNFATHIQNKVSLWTLLLLSIFIFSYRSNNINEKEISWDVLGYYLYLPATFIQEDPLLNDISWLEKINEEKELTDTLYMISSNDEGEPMYFFLMGTAILYFPFFIIGHIIALFGGFPVDGFSMPYTLAISYGAILYTLLGLYYFRKILRYFFSENITAIVLMVIVIGTNYVHHMTLKNLETVNFIFTFVAICIWNTIKWHENYKTKHLLYICLSITILCLIKPTEILIAFFPIFYNINSKQELIDKWKKLIVNKKGIIITITACLLLALPQISYWYIKTGQIIYDSYKNPGVGLDLTSPHIFNILFSLRKGWLIYTPILIFSLIGFKYMYQQNKTIFKASLIYFGLSFYLISSWTEWWYGASFSIRPFIGLYPILGISFGYFLLHISDKKNTIKLGIGLVFLALISLNQFQWWQLKNYILDPYRTTPAYYWATFLQTTVSEKDKKLLLVDRNFSGINSLDDKKSYACSLDLKKGQLNKMLTEKEQFFMLMHKEYREITKKDHFWIETKVQVESKDSSIIENTYLISTMEHKGGAYGYFSSSFKHIKENIYEATQTFLSPPVRNKSDNYKNYIWKNNSEKIVVKSYKLKVYEKKN
jgi:hypothetical protein